MGLSERAFGGRVHLRLVTDPPRLRLAAIFEAEEIVQYADLVDAEQVTCQVVTSVCSVGVPRRRVGA